MLYSNHSFLYYISAISINTFNLISTDQPSNSISDSGETLLTFSVSILNRGVAIPTNGEGDNFAFKLHLNNNNSLVDSTEVPGVTFGSMDDPAASAAILSMELVEYAAVTANINLPEGSCLGIYNTFLLHRHIHVLKHTYNT